mmetsp:Transcript_15228/g.20368  ORF Transcript_15228/g.20368 Transcript_15228/m.20368 type:complete len:91 (+) Transcript_15228:984-1256(+)
MGSFTNKLLQMKELLIFFSEIMTKTKRLNIMVKHTAFTLNGEPKAKQMTFAKTFRFKRFSLPLITLRSLSQCASGLIFDLINFKNIFDIN